MFFTLENQIILLFFTFESKKIAYCYEFIKLNSSAWAGDLAVSIPHRTAAFSFLLVV